MRSWLSRRSVVSLLALGVSIREILSFWTGHPWDMEVWLRNGYYVSRGINPYTLMAPVPGLSFAYTNVDLPSVGYLPLWSLLLASIYDLYSALPFGNRFLLYFLIKQPPILGDVLLGCVIYRAVGLWGRNPRVAKETLTFWMLFPYGIFISAIWGQFDFLVASLVVLSLLATRPLRGWALTGVGILLKFFPLIFVPYFLIRWKGARPSGVVVAVAIPLVFTAFAFLAAGWAYSGLRGTLEFGAHGVPGGLTYLSILESPPIIPYVSKIGAWFLLQGFLWLPAVTVAGIAASRLFRKGTEKDLIQATIFITAIFYLTRWNIYEQYLIYLFPLLLIDIALWHPERRSIFHFLWGLAIVYLGVNNTLFIRFVSPIYPPAFYLDYLTNNNLASGLRDVLIYALGAIFSIHVLQLVIMCVNPKKSATPWLLVPLARWRARSRAPEGSGVPKELGR